MLRWLLFACSSPPPIAEEPVDMGPSPRDHQTPRSYDKSLLEAYPPPAGFTRVPAGERATWLRARSVGPVIQPILTHRGDSVHHAARLIRVGLTGAEQLGLQSALRFEAEWRKESGLPVVFHTSAGEPLSLSTEEDWDEQLRQLYQATDPKSVWSLDTKAVTEPEPGDVLLQTIAPWHAAVILDVATRGEERMVLLGEGYIPAQYFHVEHGPFVYWWRWDPKTGIEAFREPMPASSLRRWL